MHIHSKCSPTDNTKSVIGRNYNNKPIISFLNGPDFLPNDMRGLNIRDIFASTPTVPRPLLLSSCAQTDVAGSWVSGAGEGQGWGDRFRDKSGKGLPQTPPMTLHQQPKPLARVLVMVGHSPTLCVLNPFEAPMSMTTGVLKMFTPDLATLV